MAPPSLLTCTFSPAASAPLVPDTVSVVSLVMKSLDDVPVSSAIAVIVDRRGRRRRIDGDGLAVGGADIAGRIDHPRLIAEAGGVRVAVSS